MAGGDHHPYKVDPAVERWSAMHNSMYQRFRFTPYTTRAVLLLGVAVPVLTYYAAQATDDRWEMRGKLRGESLLRHPPPAPAAADEEE